MDDPAMLTDDEICAMREAIDLTYVRARIAKNNAPSLLEVVCGVALIGIANALDKEFARRTAMRD